MEVGRGRGISGVSRAHVPFPGAGGSGRQRSLHGLSRDRDGGNGARHRRQARLVRLASVDYGVARAAGVDRRTIAERRSPSSLMPTAAAGPEIERLNAINARYHVLGGTLSPLDGIGPQDLSIDALVSRAHDPAVTEVILALNATVDGQTTAHYITDLLHGANVKVTRLAHGVPVGGELDYLDEGTLTAAIRQRTP